MALLVLVHGVCAGAWSWDLVTPHLVAAGHETLAVDLPDVAEMVFLCGAIPVPGQSIAERGAEWRAIDDGEWQIDNGDGSFSISHEGFRNHVAPDAPPRRDRMDAPATEAPVPHAVPRAVPDRPAA